MDKLNNEEFIYQKKDFIKLGIKEGSFYKMIKDLDLDTPEYCIITILRNGIKAKCFNQKAFDIISKYINEKGIRNSKNELTLINENISLKEENQKLQNAVALLESQYTKQIADLKDEWHEKEIHFKEIEIKKENLEKENQEQKQEIEQWSKRNKSLNNEVVEKEETILKISNLSLFDFIKYKRKYKKENKII